MKKTVNVRIGYYPKKNNVTGKQLSFIEDLLEKNDYGDAYQRIICKYGCRNPFKRINSVNASKLITALQNGDKIVFNDHS